MEFQQGSDAFDAGTCVAASLSTVTLGQLEPMLRRFLCGQQLFVKQSDGTYRPKGCQLGLARSFQFGELTRPALSHT